ncbi:MAG: hypothetical protein HOJ31_10315 [Anaerolineae bacterium]|jgi:hypothetical protein|nr:hypothetical protein [Anaerolineae bacterium]
MNLTIDSIDYNVPLIVMSRTGEILFKYAERTEDGVLHAEAIGTYYNFKVECGQSLNNEADYTALWLKITDPDHEHTMVLPDGTSGTKTVNVYFSAQRDEVKKWKIGTQNLYRAMSFSIISIEPARTP